MAQDSGSEFLKTLAEQLAENGRFVDLVADHVAGRLLGQQHAAGAGRGAKKTGRGPGRPPGSGAKGGGRKGGAADRVLAAIRGGATKRSDIMSKSGVSAAGYSYGIKALKQRGLVKVQGSRGQAKIVAV